MHEYLRGDDSEIDHIQVERWSFFLMETTNGYISKREGRAFVRSWMQDKFLPMDYDHYLFQ